MHTIKKIEIHYIDETIEELKKLRSTLEDILAENLEIVSEEDDEGRIGPQVSSESIEKVAEYITERFDMEEV